MKNMAYLNAQITTQAVIKNIKNEILLLKRNKPGGWFTLEKLFNDETVDPYIKKQELKEFML